MTKVVSKGQQGGITAGHITIGGPQPPTPNQSWGILKWVGLVSAVLGIPAAAITILVYFGVIPPLW